MKTILIAEDAENGSFSAQLRWCKLNGVLGSGQGPLIEVDPAFPSPQFRERVRKNNGALPKVRLSKCGKFGGVCSSKKCREGHQKLLSA